MTSFSPDVQDMTSCSYQIPFVGFFRSDASKVGVNVLDFQELPHQLGGLLGGFGFMVLGVRG